MLVVILQRQLFTRYQVFEVEGNPYAPPSSPVASEQLIAINSCTPVTDGYKVVGKTWLYRLMMQLLQSTKTFLLVLKNMQKTLNVS